MPLTRREMLAATALTINLLPFPLRSLANVDTSAGLSALFRDDFYIGTAIGAKKLRRMPSLYKSIVTGEFNALTMENDMKWERIHPEPGQWQWQLADKFVDFAQQHNMYRVGHVLVWHSQVPEWVFQNEAGKPLSKRALLARMQDHIVTLAGRYRGRMEAWDVVNEAIDEDKGWRTSPWYNIIGPEFVAEAFNYTHEVDPAAHLIYNDYNMHLPAKRNFVVKMLRDFKKRGVPIHGVGMQGHVGLDFPCLGEFEKSIEAFAAEGVKVHITELDMDVLPVAWDFTGAEISTKFEYSDELNPFPYGLPKWVEQKLNDRYATLFELFLKHRNAIERVTFWGTGDAESWKNDFPVAGRTNYPLLFDRQYNKKACYHAIADLKRH